MKIRAAVFEDVKKIVYRDDYPKPVPGPDEVIVRVHYCGICGSDISNFIHKIYQTPLIMGHEISGEIAELGENVSNWKKGDKVVAVNVALEIGQVAGMGIFQDGGFAEYVKVNQNNVFLPPESLSNRDAVLIETFANAIRGITLSNIGNNEKIIIIGAGSIGLSFLNTLIKEKNPEYIIVIEPHEFLRERAKEIGATEVFPPKVVKVKKFMKSHGKSTFIFDCAGNENTIKMAMDLIKKGGTILLEGIHKGSIDFPIFTINSKEICFKGCMGHDKEDILGAIKLFEDNKVNPSHFITDVIPLNKIQTGFERFLKPGERDFIKILVEI